MKHTLIFAWRNLWRNKRRTYITISSIVFAVIIASFMRGMQLGSYEKMINDAIKSTTGHVAIMDKDFPEVKLLTGSDGNPRQFGEYPKWPEPFPSAQVPLRKGKMVLVLAMVVTQYGFRYY